MWAYFVVVGWLVVVVSQVVSHVLRPAALHHAAAGPAYHSAAAPPPHPPRVAARDVLLHHDRLAQLPVRGDRLLDVPRAAHRARDGRQAARRRPRLGQEDRLDARAPPAGRSIGRSVVSVPHSHTPVIGLHSASVRVSHLLPSGETTPFATHLPREYVLSAS